MASNIVTTRFSGGNVALPVLIQCELGIQEGDSLNASVEDGRIVLTPQEKPVPLDQPVFEPRIIRDPILGTPALTLGPDAPVLTSEEVAEILNSYI